MDLKQPKTLLSPTSVIAFMEALNGERGALDAWLECNDEKEVRTHIKAAIQRQHANMSELEAHRKELLGALKQIELQTTQNSIRTIASTALNKVQTSLACQHARQSTFQCINQN